LQWEQDTGTANVQEDSSGSASPPLPSPPLPGSASPRRHTVAARRRAAAAAGVRLGPSGRSGCAHPAGGGGGTQLTRRRGKEAGPLAGGEGGGVAKVVERERARAGDASRAEGP